MRWKCGCAYDGTDYAGWQTQDGPLSVQQVLEEVFEQIFGERVGIVGSGRTDAGVHAEGQVFHFDFDWKHGPDKLVAAAQSLLPEAIQISYAEPVEDDFHARFSAVSKRYRYQIHMGQASPFDARYCWGLRGDLDFQAINAALSLIVGEHDFAAFGANRGIEYESTKRTMIEAKLVQDPRFVYLHFQANGFLYKMARSLVGTLVNVGQGRLDPSDVRTLLETGVRTPLVFVAPPQGLRLESVFY